MPTRRPGRALFRLSVPAVLMAGVAGCSSNNIARDIAAMNDSNIRRVTNLYTASMVRNGWKGPKDEAAFKAFIREYDPDKLQAMQVDPGNVDRIFTSERDGKPFKIRYGQGGGPGAAIAVTFEEEGREGRRQVGFTNGTVEEVDDVRYKQLWTGQGSTPGGPTPGGPPAVTGPNNRPTGPPPGAPTGPPGS